MEFNLIWNEKVKIQEKVNLKKPSPRRGFSVWYALSSSLVPSAAKTPPGVCWRRTVGEREKREKENGRNISSKTRIVLSCYTERGRKIGKSQVRIYDTIIRPFDLFTLEWNSQFSIFLYYIFFLFFSRNFSLTPNQTFFFIRYTFCSSIEYPKIQMTKFCKSKKKISIVRNQK